MATAPRQNRTRAASKTKLTDLCSACVCGIRHKTRVIMPVYHLLGALTLLGVLTGPSKAMVIDGKVIEQSGQGTFVVLNPDNGFSVGYDTFDDDNLYAFDEDQNIVLIEPVRVDIGPMSLIPAGTEVASHYVFFDSLSGVQMGFVDFDAPILGIAAFEPTMSATDYLANTEVTYISPELRGLEDGDQAWIDPVYPQRLWVNWAGSSPGDYIRVFTERSPNALVM